MLLLDKLIWAKIPSIPTLSQHPLSRTDKETINVSGLTDPSINSLSVWLSMFEKCWLRSKYPTKYDEEKEKLLSSLSKKTKKKKRRTLRKTYAIRKQLSRLLIKKDDDEEKNPITVLKAGVLNVNIIEAEELPQSNINIITAPNTYCKFYVTNNDPCYGKTKIYSTKIQHDKSPKWNENQNILITNTTGQLIIELWSIDIYNKHTLIGTVEIELNYLVLHYYGNEESEDIDRWFPVTLVEKQKESINKNDVENKNNDDNDDDDDDYNDSNFVLQKKMGSLQSAKSDTKCSIRLQIKLTLTSPFWSHFISHFDPVLPQPQQIPFNMNLCYIEAYRIYLLIDKIVIQGSTVTDTLFWRKWTYSVIGLVHIACFVYYPWFLFFYFELVLLIAICTSYAILTTFATPAWTDKTKQFNLPYILHVICICFGGLPAMAINKSKQKIKKEINDASEPSMISSEETKNNEQNEDEHQEEKMESMDMPKVAKFCVKRILEATESNEGLWFPQEVLVWINEFVLYLIEIFEWKYVPIASMMVIGLFIGCILSLILKDTMIAQHQFFAVLAALFCFYSKPIQFLLWLITGILYYYHNYYEEYKQYKSKQRPSFIRAKPLKISDTESMRESIENYKTKHNKQNKCKLVIKILKYMLIPLLILKDFIHGLFKFIIMMISKFMNSKIITNDEAEYDPSKLCKISLINQDSKYLCCKSTENICFCNDSDCVGSEHIFYSIPISSDRINTNSIPINSIVLKSGNVNTYISAQSNGKIMIDKTKVFEFETFEVIQQDSFNKIAFKCCNQKYLSSEINQNENYDQIFKGERNLLTLSFKTENTPLCQKNKLSENGKFIVKLINNNNDDDDDDDDGEELKMEEVLPSDQLSTHNTYLFAGKEKKKATIIREQVIRNLVNEKKFGLILAKLKSLKLISF